MADMNVAEVGQTSEDRSWSESPASLASPAANSSTHYQNVACKTKDQNFTQRLAVATRLSAASKAC